jgi:hypothetical protein
MIRVYSHFTIPFSRSLTNCSPALTHRKYESFAHTSAHTQTNKTYTKQTHIHKHTVHIYIQICPVSLPFICVMGMNLTAVNSVIRRTLSTTAWLFGLRPQIIINTWIPLIGRLMLTVAKRAWLNR